MLCCVPLQVREAMAQLLVAVSRSRSLHFYEVVPLDALLSVMAVDAPSVSGPIQSILLPSYFPDPDEGAVSDMSTLVSVHGHTLLPYLIGSARFRVVQALPCYICFALLIDCTVCSKVTCVLFTYTTVRHYTVSGAPQ